MATHVHVSGADGCDDLGLLWWPDHPPHPKQALGTHIPKALDAHTQSPGDPHTQSPGDPHTQSPGDPHTCICVLAVLMAVSRPALADVTWLDSSGKLEGRWQVRRQ